MRRPAALVFVLAVLACSRTPREPESRETQAASPSAPPPRAASAFLSAAPETAEQPFRFPAAERVVAVGDLHGDLASTREALRLAGAIDENDRWVGEKLVLVQVGDQLDRGDDEPQILELLERLAADAAKSGGAVHVLNGNHEVMNVAGDLRYVTEDGFRDYAAVPAPSGTNPARELPPEARGRAAAFQPGSPLARKLAQRNTIAIVGDTLFAHAGVLSKHVRYGIGRINDDVRRYLRGDVATAPDIAIGDDAPIWTRAYGGPEPGAAACRELAAVLEALSVKRLVVGHTVQKAGVTSACDGRVYRADVGLSDYYGKNPTQVLELTASGVKVLGSQ
jgi:hypothetical protein